LLVVDKYSIQYYPCGRISARTSRCSYYS